MHDKKRYLKYFIIFALIFLFCILAESEYSYNMHNYPSEGTAWTQLQQGEGYLLDQFSLNLNRGKYELKFDYTLTQDESPSSFWLVDPTRFSQDGGPYRIAEGQLDADQKSITIPVFLDRDIYGINVVFETPSAIQGWAVTLIKSDFTDWIFLFLFLSCLMYVLIRKTNWESHQYALLLFFVGIFLTLPFAGNRLMSAHDLTFHTTRIKGIADALTSGQFPARLNPSFNWGYGYINSILYPELFLYIPATFYLLGMSLMSAYKTLILLINVSTGLIGYYSFSKLLDSRKLGAVCGFLYLVNPYRLSNIFLRAAIGEALAEVFLPLLVYGIVELIRGDYKKWYITVFAATGIFQSHILSMEISALFVGIFLIISWKYYVSGVFGKRLLCWLKTVAVFLGINLWFLVPFFDHFAKGYNIINDNHSISDSSVNLWQMFFSFFDMEGWDVPNGLTDEMPFTIGVCLLIGCFIFIYYSYCRHTLPDKMQRTGRLCLAFGGISCYMASEYFPWSFLGKNLSVLCTILVKIQFPWRMLGFSSLFLSIVTAIGIYALWNDRKELLPNILLALSILLALRCMDGYLTDENVLTNSRSQALEPPYNIDYYRGDIAYTDYNPLREQRGKITVDSEISMKDFQSKGTSLKFHFDRTESLQSTILQFPRYNYGLYKAYVNGNETPITSGKYGMVCIEIPEKVRSGDIELVYYGRKAYRAAEICSLLTILALAGYGIVRKKRR